MQIDFVAEQRIRLREPGMNTTALRERAERLLALADIRINGPDPTDPVIQDERTYARAFAHGSLGFGEAYMDGWWDVRIWPAC